MIMMVVTVMMTSDDDGWVDKRAPRGESTRRGDESRTPVRSRRVASARREHPSGRGDGLSKNSSFSGDALSNVGARRRKRGDVGGTSTRRSRAGDREAREMGVRARVGAGGVRGDARGERGRGESAAAAEDRLLGRLDECVVLCEAVRTRRVHAAE